MREIVKGLVYRFLPVPVRIQGLPFYLENCALDFWDRVRNRCPFNVPPRRLNVSGRGSFLGIGQHNLDLCVRLGRLKATDTVLDVGCGIGRTATALCEFLMPSSRYVGMDIIHFAILWCQSHISPANPNFQFVFSNIRNKTYNPGGALSAQHFSLPYTSGTFTFCIATSLFTHLLPKATEHYLKEIGRVLCADGRFLSTWFLLNKETQSRMTEGSSHLSFHHAFVDHAQQSLHAPEQAVA